MDALLQRNTMGYDAAGRQVVSVNALAWRTTTVYDAAGNSIAQVSPLAQRTTTAYNAAGRVIANINPLSQRITTTYDAAGRSVASVNPLDRRTTTVYDLNGRAIVSINPLLAATTTVYDAAGNSIAQINPLGYRTTSIYNSSNQKIALRNARDKDGFGHRTYNHYIQAFDSFMNWCVLTKKLLVNPILGMERLNVETDIRHPRRALTPDEIQQLIASARQSNALIQCFTGEQRARIYILSYMTGLRRNEIASLTPRSFDLKNKQPTLTVDAKSSKHKKKDVLPIHQDFVVTVGEWLKGLKPGEKLFPKLGNRRTWLMVKKDLERVCIPYETEEGIADFHAAGRHTHITELLRNGASLPEAQKLARHSDIKMTMKYTHIGIEDQARAVANLPSLALHGRCKSGVVGRHLVATPGKRARSKESENPCGCKGLGVDCQSLATAGNVEAAGIE